MKRREKAGIMLYYSWVVTPVGEEALGCGRTTEPNLHSDRSVIISSRFNNYTNTLLSKIYHTNYHSSLSASKYTTTTCTSVACPNR
jgi:hypothetical protein